MYLKHLLSRCIFPLNNVGTVRARYDIIQKSYRPRVIVPRHVIAYSQRALVCVCVCTRYKRGRDEGERMGQREGERATPANNRSRIGLSPSEITQLRLLN